MKRMTPPGDDKLAREFLDAVLRHDTTVINDRIASILLQNGPIDDSLARAAAELPAGPIDTLRQVGVDVSKSAEDTTTFIIYELHGASGWGEVSVLIGDQGDQRKIFGFRTNRLGASIEATNGFSQGAKDPIRLLVLVLAAGLPIFCLAVAVMAIRARIPRRWLWALFALIGGSEVTLNWTTGAVSYNPFLLVLLSSEVLRVGVVGPWLVSVAFPAGAIATLYRIRRKTETPPPTAESSEPANPAAPTD